jgi:predicted nucleic-acid-binding protein
MITFDTNLLVRALAMDNPAQAAIARTFMAEDTVFLSLTVLL